MIARRMVDTAVLVDYCDATCHVGTHQMYWCALAYLSVHQIDGAQAGEHTYPAVASGWALNRQLVDEMRSFLETMNGENDGCLFF